MILVKALILGLFLSLIGGCASTDKPNVSGKEVIVIGAGIAGLNAAKIMQSQGFKVTILESRNRIGGRLWSDKSMDNVTLDLGASWIHGIQNNPIHKLAKDNNITMFEWDYDNGALYDKDGNEDPVQAARIESLDAKLEPWVYNPLNLNLSIDEVIEAARDDGALVGYSEEEINYFVSANIENEYAGPSSKLSVEALNEGSALGGAEIIFPGGYDQLATILAKDLTILTNHKVTEVNYESTRPIVKANDKTFAADHVLVTVPLGVLKRNIIHFTPALPTNKANAIQALDMGTLNKVYLKFPTAFWQPEAMNMGYISDPKGQYNYWLNLVEATGQPVLLAFTAADYGKNMENFSDEEIVADAITVLKNIYGNDIPDPEQSVITRWASDPHSFGSYSFMTTEANASMREDLAEPIQGKVFFAGEATHGDFPATVQGAYMSGEREAERILGGYR